MCFKSVLRNLTSFSRTTGRSRRRTRVYRSKIVFLYPCTDDGVHPLRVHPLLFGVHWLCRNKRRYCICNVKIRRRRTGLLLSRKSKRIRTYASSYGHGGYIVSKKCSHGSYLSIVPFTLRRTYV